ncbi:hypothetical protein VTH82DRAFT_3848 [Thermothelomyces myriococcoides]
MPGFPDRIAPSRVRRKQEVRCQATLLNPFPTRESSLKCDDECLRLQRNRKLAEALNIDPETHTDDHIPYSDTTLRRFRENISWAQEQERQLRLFAADPEQKRLRFKHMPSHQRAFIHALAEDFGLETESQDPEPHRHVCVFKTPRFVSAPQKTLAQCIRIANTAAKLGTGASAVKPAQPTPAQQPQQPSFNALLLKEPRFGLTIDELEAALSPELAAAARSGPALNFTTNFLPLTEEIVIKATPNLTAAAVATSLASTPQAVEAVLNKLKSEATEKIVSQEKLVGAVALCHVDASGTITHREKDTGATSSGGWSAVAGRGSWRKLTSKTSAEAAAAEQRAPSAFVALRRLEARKKKKETAAPVEEDWLAAVEKEEKEEKRGEAGSSDGSENVDATGDEGVSSGNIDANVETGREKEGKEELEVEESKTEGDKIENPVTETEVTKAENTKEEEAVLGS